MTKERQAVSPENKNRRHLFLCQADEIQGEHERLIQFLVRAATPGWATRRAREHLRTEWCVREDAPDRTDEDAVASFFNGEIIIRRLEIRKLNHDEALSYFIRP